MTILQVPASYSFAGNIADIIVDTTEELSFALSLGDVQIISETYHPSPSNRIVIDLRNILELLVEVPGYDTTSVAIEQYTYTIGTTTGTFRCLPGGHGASVSAEVFLRGNFLTWQPQTRTTLYHTPHKLRYAALDACVCKVKGYFADGTNSTVTLLSMVANTIYTMDVSFGTIRGEFSTQPTYYDIWVEDALGGAMTWVQRYLLVDSEAGTSDYFIFGNSLGGYDTIRFGGDRKEINKLESVNAVFGEETLEYDIDRTRSWKKYTGYIADNNVRMWVLDFFNSPSRYYLTNSGALQRIYVSEPKVEDTAGEAAGYEFNYAYSRQSRYINIERVETPSLLDITDPQSEVFFLAPRLNQFECASPSAADYLIPVQAPAAGKWLTLSVQALIDYIKPQGIDVDALAEYLRDHSYATHGWIAEQNYLTSVDMSNYLLTSTWSESFAVETVETRKVIRAKLPMIADQDIVAVTTPTTSPASFGSLGSLNNVGAWADEIPTVARVMVQLAGATHWSSKPLSELVGTSDWDDILNKPTTFAPSTHTHAYGDLIGTPTMWAWSAISDKPTTYAPSAHGHAYSEITGTPTSLPASDVSAWAKAATKPSYTASEVGALAKSTWDTAFAVETVSGQTIVRAKIPMIADQDIVAVNALAYTTTGGIDYDALKSALSGATTPTGYPFAIASAYLTSIDKTYLTGKLSGTYANATHTHAYGDISGVPTSLPANGGNADTVDGLHAAAMGVVEGGKLVSYNAYGYVNAVIYRDTFDVVDGLGVASICYKTSQADGYHRFCSLSRLKSVLGSMPASDVYAWAKAASKPSYTPAEIGALALTGGTMTGDTTLPINIAIKDSNGLHLLKSDNVYSYYGNRGKQLVLISNASIPIVQRTVGGAVINYTNWDSGNLTYLTQLTNNLVPAWALASSNYYLPSDDTRSVNFAPFDGGLPKGLTTVHLKTNGVDGLSDGGAFHSSLHVAPWGDLSGGHMHNISLTDNGNLWMRHGTTAWSSWVKVYHAGNSNLSTVDWTANNLNVAANLDVAGRAYATDWFCSRGDSGWYSQTYGGGFWMIDSYWVRVFGGKSLFVPADLQVNGATILGGAVSVNSSITATGLETQGSSSAGTLPYVLWHIPGITYTRIRMDNAGSLHVIDGGAENHKNLYVNSLVAGDTLTATKLIIGGLTIDVYNGALRINGNTIVTGQLSATS